MAALDYYYNPGVTGVGCKHLPPSHGSDSPAQEKQTKFANRVVNQELKVNAMAHQKAASLSPRGPQSAKPGGSAPPPQPSYMPKPGTSVVCPPGLEYLTAIDQVIIQQELELAEAMLGVETCNKYTAKNKEGQLIWNIKEDSNCCTRVCCGQSRCLVMDVLDYKNDAVMRFVRPLRCTQCWCFCCLQVMEVQAPPGTLIGHVRQRWSICYPTYGIYDRNGTRVLDIVGPFCTSSMPCKCDVDFEVRSANGAAIGKITKKWSGILKELFTDADTFGVTFPMDLDVCMKAALIAATMLIDYTFFEQTCGRGADDAPGMVA
ncbi:phospholipid scramblase 2-like [Dermacentor silvarum]|uniref:phospholipid scramblase 2-like n=1 Tax=Dermacentor silvarum TaxID=543639 RepID=UPI0021009DC6|nr:phospholipid scramblase 2-like [Dermacentor silvarum]